MSAGKYTLSLTAAAQMALMSKAEKDRLNAFFANEANQTPANTASVGKDGFVSRVGRKRIPDRQQALPAFDRGRDDRDRGHGR